MEWNLESVISPKAILLILLSSTPQHAHESNEPFGKLANNYFSINDETLHCNYDS